MAEINNVIAEASQDLQTIEDFVNLPAGSDVRPRLLPSVNVGTLAGARQAIFEAGGLPATPFATKALMTASALVDGNYAMVTDETANNGLYVKEAGAWVKSKYSTSTDATKYAKALSALPPPTSGKNLYDAVDVNTGAYISSTGEIISGGFYTYSKNMPVIPDEVYTLSSAASKLGISGVIYYTVDMTFIKRDLVDTSTAPFTFTVPNNAYFLAFNSTIGNNADSKIMLNKGATALPFEAYIKPVLSGVSLASNNIEQVKNALTPNMFDVEHVRKSINMFAPQDVTVGSYYSSTGTLIASSLHGYTIKYPIEPSTDYSVSWDMGVGNNAVVDIAVFDASGNFLVRNSAQLTGFKTYKSPANAALIALNVSSSLYQSGKVMLYKGAEQIPYAEKGAVELVNVTGLSGQTDINKTDLNAFSDNHLAVSTNLFDANNSNIRHGAISPSQLKIIPDAAKYVSDYIKVAEGADYTVSSAVGYNAFGVVGFCDSNKNILSSMYVTNDAKPNRTVTFKTPVGTVYIVLDFTGLAVDGKRMLNKGTTALPFEFGGLQIHDVALNNVDVDGYKLKGKLVSAAADDARLGDEIHFTGDKHQAVLLDFPDSFTTSDPVHFPYAASITYQFMVDMWQGLVDEFPDYITKKKIGTDSSGTLDVHSYTFKPIKVSRAFYMAHEEPNYPRVLIYVQHIERLNQLYPFMAMREICRKWQTDPVLAALRYQVEFVVIPYGHPHGLGGGHYRFTSEGLNTNGDWPYLWNHVDDPLNGSAPFATQEARNVKAVMEEFKPHVFMDLHANSYSEDVYGGMWIDADANPRYENSVRTAILSLYPKVVERYPDAEPLHKQLYVTYHNAPRQAPGYGYAMGCTGGLMEFINNYKNRPLTDGIYNDNLVLASSYLLNAIVQCIAEYRDYGRPNKGELYNGSGVYTPTYYRGKWA